MTEVEEAVNQMAEGRYLGLDAFTANVIHHFMWYYQVRSLEDHGGLLKS